MILLYVAELAVSYVAFHVSTGYTLLSLNSRKVFWCLVLLTVFAARRENCCSDVLLPALRIVLLTSGLVLLAVSMC
jgi:hypothetical protein